MTAIKYGAAALLQLVYDNAVTSAPGNSAVGVYSTDASQVWTYTTLCRQ